MSILTTGSAITFSDGSTQSSGKPVAKAFVNFNSGGTTYSEYNVSSVTRNSTGNYTINYINPLSSTQYVVVVSSSSNSGGGAQTWEIADSGPNLNSGGFSLSNMTTTFVRIQGGSSGTSVPYDAYMNCVAIFDI